MRPIFLLWGTISMICLSSCGTYANNKCYEAKICIHDGKEKCGRDHDGKTKRFLDSCDIKEFNCLRGTEYNKVDEDECDDLPRIGERDSKENGKTTSDSHQNLDADDVTEKETQKNVENQPENQSGTEKTLDLSDSKDDEESQRSRKEKRTKRKLRNKN